MNWKKKGVASLCVYLFLAVTLSSLIVSVNSSPDTVYSALPSSFTGSIDDTITLEVNVTDASFLYSWQVYMSWDDTIFSYSSFAWGGFLSDQPEGSSTNLRIESNFVIFGEATVGPYAGKTADEGLLFEISFVILQEVASTIHIDHATFTYYIEVFSPPQQNKITDFAKENSDFAAPWAEDFDKDGIVDIWDISVVCILYGEPLIVTKSPTLWDLDPADEWANPGYAVASNDAYAETSSDGATETYGGYGGFNMYDGSVTVEVGVEAYQQDAGEWVYIRVSTDGGSTFPVTHDIRDYIPLGGSDPGTPTWIDVTGDFTSWDASMLSDGNLQVQIEYDKSGSSKLVYLDWIPVRVTYDPVADLDNSGLVDITDLSMVAVKFGETYL